MRFFEYWWERVRVVAPVVLVGLAFGIRRAMDYYWE